MEPGQLALIAAFLLLYAAASKRLEETVVTPPMAFALFGLAIGPNGLGLVAADVESESLRALAEATLILILFADASMINLRVLKRAYRLPLRLLGVGLPLNMALGTLAASRLLPELSLWEAALLAAILTPTDAALGQPVVTNSDLPARVRQGLIVESGLNDGMCLPFVLFFISMASGEISRAPDYWATFAVSQLVLGPLVGAATGYFGGRLLTRSAERRWIAEPFERISAAALALLAFGAAEWVGGNGFIAAFTGGLVLGNSSPAVCPKMHDFAEAEGQVLGLSAFFVFGAADILPALNVLRWEGLLYAVLSLTVIRMLPVSAGLIGSGFSRASHLFIGWFGPRGLASILYALLAVGDERVAHGDLIYATCVITVLLSVVLHGATASAWSRRYAAVAAREKSGRPGRAEQHPVEEMAARFAFRGKRGRR